MADPAPRLSLLAGAMAVLWLAAADGSNAQERAQAVSASLRPACMGNADDWRVSPALDSRVVGDRVTCIRDGNRPFLRIRIEPRDAYDGDNAGKPSERVELQARRELVRFGEPVWYHFRVRPLSPWIETDNRTVIHQIKQNIATEHTKAHGGRCDAANPLLKIELRGEHGAALFRVAKAGTPACGDSRGQAVICGPWPVALDRWHDVHVALFASQTEGESDVRVWLDGRACPRFAGMLGYPAEGRRNASGRPVIDAQPRFGIYRDALDRGQAIDFDQIAFWPANPAGDPAWRLIEQQPSGTASLALTRR